MNILIWSTDKAVDGLLCYHYGRINHGADTVCYLELPVINSRNLSNHITDTGIYEFVGCGLNYISINNNTVGHLGGNRISLAVNQKRGTRA